MRWTFPQVARGWLLLAMFGLVVGAATFVSSMVLELQQELQAALYAISIACLTIGGLRLFKR
ncbi:MAG: hypothetical protein AB1566_08875 [Chloroflexota bacterium]